jgi:hypothetical protein
MNAVVATQDTTNIDELIARYAQEFYHYCKKTVENHLNPGRVIYECSVNVSNETDFERFCELVGIDKDSSTLRKYKIIGKHFVALDSHRDKLPINWTTLYDLARLGNEKIEMLISSGLVNSNTTGAELRALAKNKTGSNLPQLIEDESDVIEGEIVQNGTTEEMLCSIFINPEILENQDCILVLIKCLDGIKALGANCKLTDKFSNLVA